MKPVGHVVTSGALGLAVYALRGDLSPAASCFLAGCLVDLDHVFDWVNSLGLRRGLLALANVYNNFDYESFDESKCEMTRVYLFLHSWELIIGFWGLYTFYPIDPIITGAFLGLTLHLFLDQTFNGIKPLAYFFTYRMSYRFRTCCIY
ncbi:MAG: hypothetical protein ACE5KK_00590 [Candidatus Brocadiales bacterium]